MTNQHELPAVSITWCRKCLSGYCRTAVCPQCKVSSDEPLDAKSLRLIRLLLNTQLRSVLADFSYFVEQMQAGSLKDLLGSISAETLDDTECNTNVIGNFYFPFLSDLQSVNQPSESLRTLLFAVLGQLDEKARGEFLARPQIVALNFQDVLPPEEQFEDNLYMPFPPLRLTTHEEALKNAILYLATREAFSNQSWHENFSKSLASGFLSAAEVQSETEAWRHISAQGKRVQKPLTPWLLTLKRLGWEGEAPEDLCVLAGIANYCLQVKTFWAAEEIARATLKLAHEVEEAGGFAQDVQKKEALLINLKSVLARCASMSDDDMASDRARMELVGASIDAVAGPLCEAAGAPADAFAEELIPFADVMVQLQFADQCFNDGALEKAELKYTRVIFTCKGAFEGNKHDEDSAPKSPAERIMSTLPDILSISTTSFPLVRATIRLAEVKIKKSELQAAEELLNNALHYANASVQRSTSALASLDRPGTPTLTATRSLANELSNQVTRTMNNLKVIVFGNLARIYDENGQRQKAITFAKKARKMLSAVKASDLNGFAISHNEIVQLCEKLKK